MRRNKVLVLGVAALTAAGVAAAAPATAGLTRASRIAVAGSAPSWTSRAARVGPARASSRIPFQVVLSLRNPAQAAALAQAVSNPKSPQYGHYLSAGQFNARFAPTTQQAHRVATFLRSAGLRVTGLAQGNRWVSAVGTTAQIERAFSVTLNRYRLNGRTLRAASRSLTVPTALAGIVAGVTGVSQTASVRRPASVHPADALPAPSACSAYWDQHEQTMPTAYGKTSFPTVGCGYSPAQLRTAYGVQSTVKHGTTGRGVTVAIIDAYASSSILADANQYSVAQSEPQFTAGQFSETDMTPFGLQDECGGADGWNEEETLDVEAVHGLAPGANIRYIGASDCDTGIDAAVNYVIQNQVASIVSNSYGFDGEDGLGSEVALEHSEFVQAAAEGIGFYYSSGDNGDNVILGTPHPEPDYPASDPLVTGVGGTSLATTSTGAYKFETSWGDDLASVNFATTPASYATPPPGSFIFGGGGGVSALYSEPTYQRLAVPGSLAKLNGPTAMRVVPDVAAVGDPETGFTINFHGTLGVIGGTSLACPVFAGFQALASQGRRHPIGFANPLLYALNLTGLVFHDVKAPASPLAIATISGRSLLTLGQDSSLTSTRGYDDTTGLGTPSGALLVLGEAIL